ncbi:MULTISPECIES: tRNA (adenosine(37)-N6)-threonylcarbamoyltransferase complex ATPase subunit type 1 TsaE [Paenibacillus]|uniref:tRNA (adenosine(37)-N6)-threonylcarbamoyltransferase complex ATPase subunit type 1 TsaE n=1 Tax=Paenibacillus TaxID=44249 RepID=UPI0022B915DD|nr:tRNA (adenosine(37)-N6)-threonylcarbamoyltransferase complex ATPase subunit type 1 TsaE [Paenibacillus caseinilyticus]MCZ8524017.1 tRNA (adenosine(37)-N6)-threonylcarbamoyltransferase complex ATPase subunit type 1 TsaE [Paenibacillus caseinilyticus]
MPSYQYISRSVEDTASLAQGVARLFDRGTVITLDGDLGAGKTTFSQAVAKAIGVKDIVNSPTFTIIKEYKGDKLPFYHMDVYRLSADEADELGLDDYFYGDGVTLVEWASLIEDLLPEDRLEIRIGLLEGMERLFTLTPRGERYEQWCKQAKENGTL